MRSWAMLDCRPNSKELDPTDRCLVWTPDDSLIVGEGLRVTTLLADKTEGVSRVIGNKLESDLGIMLTDANDGESMMKHLFFGRQETRWGSVQPSGLTGNKDIWLAGTLWARENAKVSKELGVDPSDNFTRADETPLGAPWVRLTGGSGNANLVSNGITASASGDKIYYYLGAAVTSSQYSELTQISAVTNDDWAPFLKVSADLGFSGYGYTPYSSGSSERFFKLVSGTYTDFGHVNVTDIANGIAWKVEMTGSSISGYRAGVLVAGPTSDIDASMAGAGLGVGFFLYDSGGSLGPWSGGDLGAATTSRPIFRHKNQHMIIR